MAKLSAEIQAKIRALKEQFPQRRSAVLPALHYAQAEVGYLEDETLIEIADLLELPHNATTEVVGFYTMFDQKPQGKYKLEVCHNLPCSLMGAERLIEHLELKLGIKSGETTPDGKFTLKEVECLGICGNAPAMMVGAFHYGDLNPEKVDAIVDALARDEEPPVTPAGYLDKDGDLGRPRGNGKTPVPSASAAIRDHLRAGNPKSNGKEGGE